MECNKIVSYKCTFGLCKSSFPTKEKLLRHTNTHCTNGRYKCSICNYTTGKNSCMRRHMNIHNGTYECSCTYQDCNYCTNDISALSVHIRTHTGERPYSCPDKDCNYQAISMAVLTFHRRMKEPNKNLCACPDKDCNYQAISMAALTIHMRSHTGERPFVCPHEGCSYVAASNFNLSKHIKRKHC